MCDLLDCKDCSKYQPNKNIKCQEIFNLWNEFGDVPMNDNEEIETDWNIFKAGTNKYDIWHWFEDKFNIRVVDLLYHED